MLIWLLAPAFAQEEDVSEEVVVVGTTPAKTDTHAVTTLSHEELERSAGQDLGTALSQVPGVVAARGSTDAAKPIIRGQYERRLLTLYDGVRHESQKWGLDHAPEIDPFSAGSISVVKGAAGVRYGPDAIGGVILITPPDLRTEPGVDGHLRMIGATNGGRGVLAARVDGAPEAIPGLSLTADGNFTRQAALSAPGYVLGNTGLAEWNAGTRARLQRDGGSVELALHHYDFRGGVCYCTPAETPNELLARLDDPEPVGAELWSTDYAIDRPKQQVTHDLVLLRGIAGEADDGLTVTYAYQHDHRQEYDQVRGSIEGPQYDFVLRTHSLEGWWAHRPQDTRLGDFTGGLGLSGQVQENVYAGLPLIPNYRDLGGGVFAVERVSTSDTALEVGIRYDHLSRTAFLTESAFDRLEAPGDCEADEDSARCPHSWDAVSVSMGGVFRAGNTLEARIDLSTASRFPDADELYMYGAAPTSPVYAVGDPTLPVERTTGVSPTLGVEVGPVQAEASAYANVVRNYVYFAPEIVGGEPRFDVTIQGAYPRWTFRPVDALFYGLDGGFTVGADEVVSVRAAGSIVRGIDLATGSGLVLVPPDRAQLDLQLHPRIRKLDHPFVELTGLYVAEQTRVDPQADLAPPPPDYFLLGAGLGTSFEVRGRNVTVGVEGTNLLDTTYRDYTSLLRYSAHEPGRDVRLRIGVDI